MNKFTFLWETWLDKFACAGVVAILAAMLIMFAIHEPEATASRVVSRQGAIVPRGIPQRSPEIQAALDKAKGLAEAKDYPQIIIVAQEIIQKDPTESFAYVYLARALREQGDLAKTLRNYAMAVKLNPDFVDKKSTDKIGPELKTLVRTAVIDTRKPEFKKQPEYKKSIKALYYLQRRLAGGCE